MHGTPYRPGQRGEEGALQGMRAHDFEWRTGLPALWTYAMGKYCLVFLHRLGVARRRIRVLRAWRLALDMVDSRRIAYTADRARASDDARYDRWPNLVALTERFGGRRFSMDHETAGKTKGR
jgi:hypothetical protein